MADILLFGLFGCCALTFGSALVAVYHEGIQTKKLSPPEPNSNRIGL